jgi:hypothetical protein
VHQQNDKPFARGEWLAASVILLWINIYICRDLFTRLMVATNSMHGFWAAIAQRADGSWLHPTWWPYWDNGIPFEFTYSPLVPVLTAITSAAFRISTVFAVQYVTALAYSLVPLTLFLMAWLLTRSPGYSFLAGLMYSLTSPTRVLMPDDPYSSRSFFSARRLYLMVIWDDTPHALALAFLGLVILFLALSIRKRRPAYYAAASIAIALAAAASAFSPIIVAMAALCLLFVLRREYWKQNVLLTLGIGFCGYALSARFLPPSLFSAISKDAPYGESGNWSLGSLAALAIVIAGWAVLWRYLPRWSSDWTLQCFALFAYLVSSISLLAVHFNLHFLPQAIRYRFEMEWALALLTAFVARAALTKAPQYLKLVLLVMCLALAARRVVAYCRYAKVLIRPIGLTSTIESRAAEWADQNMHGARVFLPGSISLWANAIAPLQQFNGSSWSMAYNPMRLRGDYAVYIAGQTTDEAAHISLEWLKALGVSAVCVSGAKSPEYWKAFTHPMKFEGVLPVLWRADDTTIYKVPQRTASLAHVVPESALVGNDVELGPYDAALEDPALPLADFRWEGRNRIHIRASAQPSQVISIQVNYHPGWHALSGNRALEIHKDGLGLMWLDPKCNGPCEVELEYDGGWELRFCRWLSYLALAGFVAGLVVTRRGHYE